LLILLFPHPAHPRSLPSFPTRRSSDLMRVAPPEGWRRVITATQRSTAIPTQSNPDLRLAMDPGSRTVTVALMRGLRCPGKRDLRSEEHTSELQSLRHLVCRLLLERKKN